MDCIMKVSNRKTRILNETHDKKIHADAVQLDDK